MTQKSPVVDVLSFMRTAPGCCCSRVPAPLPTRHPFFEVGERHVQRLVPEPDADGVHADAFLVQRVGVGLAKAMKLCAFDASPLGNCLELA
jgi:hypothetical protein